MTTNSPDHDIVRTTLAVLFIAILISATFWIMRPFITALVWATTIVVTTWPVMIFVQKRLGGKRALAVLVMTILLLLVFILPFTFALLSIMDKSDEFVAWAKSLAGLKLPPPPQWLENIPAIGPKLADGWRQLAVINQSDLAERLAPYARNILKWSVEKAGSVMMILVQFLLTVIISAVLYAGGDKAAVGVCRFARRLGGKNGEDAAILAAHSIRGVALGVVVTAMVQALLAGIGLALCGAPAVVLLSALVFALCVAQLGPMLVMIPVVIWLFATDQALWGSIMIVWSLVVAIIDNFIRPFLIKRGANLPLLLIFAGVIGGLIAFGVIGMFIGPVILAVTYTLLSAWVSGLGEEDSPYEGERGRPEAVAKAEGGFEP